MNPAEVQAKRNAAVRREETFRALTWHAEQSFARGEPELARLALWLREAV